MRPSRAVISQTSLEPIKIKSKEQNKDNQWLALPKEKKSFNQKQITFKTFQR